MGHAIAFDASGQAAAAYAPEDGIGWHQLGRPIPDEYRHDPDKMAEIAGVDYTVEKRECYYRLDDGTYVPAPGKDVVVRSDTQEFFSVVSDTKYNVIGRHGRDLIAAFEEDLRANRVSISHICALNNGADIVVSAKLPIQKTVGAKHLNDSIQYYITLMTGFAGHSTQAMKTEVRALCANTRAQALNRAKENGTLRNIRASTRIQAGDLRDLIESAQQEIETDAVIYDALANASMSPDQVMRYFADVLEINVEDLGRTDKQGKKLISTKSENIIKALSAAYIRAPGAQEAHGSAWGMLNAVTYYATHEKTVRDTTGSGEEATRIASNLFGDAATMKRRAYELAQQYAGIKVAA